MKSYKKILSVIICCVIFVGCFAVIPARAVTYPIMGVISSSSGKASIYSLPGTTGHETDEYKNKSQWLCYLENGAQVKIFGVENDGDGDPWYKINYGEKFENEGYAFVTRVLPKYEYCFDEDFEKNILNFPKSYHDSLRQLHAKYPNWNFLADPLDITFNEAVEAQYGMDDITKTRKWVEIAYGSDAWRDIRAYDYDTNKWLLLEERWTYASRSAIEYFIDPRNSLNEEMIFAFMQQSFVADENIETNLRAIIKNTFLEKGYDKDGNGTIEKDAYIDDLIAAANASKVSPYVLAATIIVEQGVNGTSNLISGMYQDFEGFYNFFNFNAYGSTVQEITVSGLTFAKNNDWNSRTSSIIGGAKKYAEGYIAVGQDTYYYKNFNVLNKYWNHQYASALYDAWTNASYLKKVCATSADLEFTFIIPIYKDMTENACAKPSMNVVDEWQIKPTTTGIHNIIPIKYDIKIFDHQGNEVSYFLKLGGWPFVANQIYTIKLKNDTDNYDISWRLNYIADQIFPDTSPNEWYNDAVTYTLGSGIMSGYENGKFGTSDSIQRQDFLVMLARLDGVDLTQYNDRHSSFNDVDKNSYYETAVIWGAEKGIINGYDNGKFGVGDKITREQIVTFLYRYADYKCLDVGYTNEQKYTVSNHYSDYKNVSSFAQNPIIWAISNGVINGKTSTTIVPQGNAQRCEVAQIMYNIFLNEIF